MVNYKYTDYLPQMHIDIFKNNLMKILLILISYICYRYGTANIESSIRVETMLVKGINRNRLL